MARLLRVLFVFGMIWGSMAAQVAVPKFAAGEEIRLKASRWKELSNADSADRARQPKPSEAEAQSVQQRLQELRALDANSADGQSQLMKVVEDEDTLAYIRIAVFNQLLQAELRQLGQIDATTNEGQTALLQVLQDPDSPAYIQQAVVEHLAQSHVESAAAQQFAVGLIRRDGDKYSCEWAIYQLPNLGVPAEVAVPLLIPMLEDHRNASLRGCDSGLISYAAASVLGGYGPAAKDAIPRLAWDIDAANTHERDPSIAQYALGRIAPDRYPFFAEGDAAIQPLIGELSSDIQGRRLRAAERLLSLREHAGPATAALETALDDKNEQVRANAAAALLATKLHEEASSVLKQLAKSEDKSVREMILRLVCDCELNFDSVEVLRGFVGDSEPSIRSKAAGQLAKKDRHTTEAFDAMVALYKTGEDNNKVSALLALENFRAEQLDVVKDLIADATTQKGSVGFVAKRLQSTKFARSTEAAAGK